MDTAAETTLGLETPANRRHERLEVWAERAGQLLIAVIIVTALLGLLGPGPLSHAQRTSADQHLRAEYVTIQRYESPCELTIHFEPSIAKEGEAQIAIGRGFTDKVTIEDIAPRPEHVTAADGELVYHFLVDDLHERGQVIVRYKNDRYGRIEYSVSAGSSRLQLSHFVLP